VFCWGGGGGGGGPLPQHPLAPPPPPHPPPKVHQLKSSPLNAAVSFHPMAAHIHSVLLPERSNLIGVAASRTGNQFPGESGGGLCARTDHGWIDLSFPAPEQIVSLLGAAKRLDDGR
jgi:hypothetical protein